MTQCCTKTHWMIFWCWFLLESDWKLSETSKQEFEIHKIDFYHQDHVSNEVKTLEHQSNLPTVRCPPILQWPHSPPITFRSVIESTTDRRTVLFCFVRIIKLHCQTAASIYLDSFGCLLLGLHILQLHGYYMDSSHFLDIGRHVLNLLPPYNGIIGHH